jgi:hypothetical protein
VASAEEEMPVIKKIDVPEEEEDNPKLDTDVLEEVLEGKEEEMSEEGNNEENNKENDQEGI